MRKVSVPDEGAESLYGTYDENLKQLEGQFSVRIRTNGHELIVEGEASDVARAERVLEQLAGLIRGGYKLGEGRREDRVAARLAGRERRAVATTSSAAPRRTSGKKQVMPKSVNQRRYLDAIEQHDIVFGIGPAGTGKTYLAMAQAVSSPAREEGQPHHPGAAGGRSRREAGLPAGRSAGEGQPVPAAALRRALRHDGNRARRPPARARHDRGGADCVHARPHAERCVRHPRRSAEHDVRADEDVPDAARLRLEGGDHRRHHPDRPAERQGRRGWSRR